MVNSGEFEVTPFGRPLGTGVLVVGDVVEVFKHVVTCVRKSAVYCGDGVRGKVEYIFASCRVVKVTRNDGEGTVSRWRELPHDVKSMYTPPEG